ncbi:ATP-grasp domain-containing protein [Actinorugispora endophytica]|uniref:ATP-grasp domain-containing protein n=1 Tax=Actinorugispora endophytica TaxID=1605990 RepID=A0A4R6USP3_9ACTN|nr:ATP-grasp domain-containing protein [Actinorugispora endophytica]TDQ50250.1 ATP-grasp domain-containing protein [Actinorugispora endophytica]
MAVNVFVLGLDECNEETLRALPDAGNYRFHGLLTIEELQYGDDIDIRALLEEARRRLDGFDGPVDAVIGYWDFPVTSMVPLLCRRYGLPSAPLEAVVKCEHKYWSRLVQREAIDEVPRFALVAPDATARPDGLSYPLWLKPVKSFSSELAFRVTDDAGFREALHRINEGAGHLGEPFEFVMSQVRLPPEVAEAGGSACLAEEEGRGDQVTVEGYVHQGRARVYGVVDSLRYPGASSFLRYQYPSRLPGETLDRLADLSRRVVERVGLDATTFNIEFFADAETGDVTLLEVNPRHSQSHARLFENVDGAPNHECAVRLALGRAPELPHRRGRYAVAAKCFLRHFHDGLVLRVPTPGEVERVERDVPGTVVRIVAREGERLSALHAQDSYSFELARIFVGADDEEQLRDRYQACADALDFRIDDTDDR